ncbi:hypothetical protein ACLBWX_01045 [Methylobacterium sp. M6A4_1b]
MTFSASGEAAAKVGPLLKYVHEIVAQEGFTVHPDKTRVMRRGRHQEVTGLTVNERVAVPRESLRRFRALLHGIERHGPIGRRWGRSTDGAVLGAALGFARFVRMVTPEVGTPLVAQARRLAERHGAQPKRAQPRVTAFRVRSAQGMPPRAGWWVPAEQPGPRPDPLLVEADAARAEAARGAAGAADRRVVPPIGRQPPAPRPVPAQTTDAADALAMRPWMVVVGVFVLFQAAALLHPGLGLIVLAAALTIGLRRWFRRRRDQ